METNELLGRYGTPAERVTRAAAALREGRGILLTDDENRENEGDLIFAATTMTTEQMALMIRSCSGIVCLCLPPDKARELALPLMVEHNTSRYGTAFTISIEAAEGVTTGVSASDRIQTIRAAVAPNATPASLSHPGHVFPLIARAGGVLERDGHTEGSVDLVRLAGLSPYAVLCELTNEDGTMARLPQIVEFAEQHDYPVVTIADIQAWRTTHND
ncbi:3,4-dihydroxy-2-butanone-4-phosphate synthase [Millionella massiliensis]|uniref:3,4-dihydroxy-2-butanone-4-phosphate synthase n=1 Tax=Millionella massiliensis TaxID=1871023 RepID=UPI0008D9D992|nr:3,4-dihydroxy-2-butanone-4-phosphate synthase [Millionella massiliensis]